MKTKAISATYKIVVVGPSGVGKTALVQRLVEGTFQSETQSTVGVEFKSFIVQLDNQSIKLQIWDTAGQERFKSVSKAYYRNAIGAILVYDISNVVSFDSLSTWLNDLQQLCIPNAFILLVGNKSDMESTRQVGVQQAQDYAQQNHIEFLETSAMNGNNVNEAFTRLTYGIVNRVKNGQIQVNPLATKSSPFKIEQEEPKQQDQRKNENGCC
ncbi:Ras-related protein Rab-4B [Tritrichomonas foetus]|uniref:Ras-related protein Rab-4B n=1 Tax=Tritrichomonas foetus TaxID=1144522 RepID=A0A1J4J8Z5_9EUKA|nr:Ras-related protein Rab-4B [Tritrichomonas foetus]|eukprot:OHS94719.1 Ras-related protein Rab-4B [Tritrichomonas foetus]